MAEKTFAAVISSFMIIVCISQCQTSPHQQEYGVTHVASEGDNHCDNRNGETSDLSVPSSKLLQLHALENVRDDLEYDPLPLIGQFFFTFACDLLVDPFLPTKDLDHANDVHDLGHNLDTRVRLRKKPR